MLFCMNSCCFPPLIFHHIGLPAFFQNSGTTVLDELTNFELGGHEDDDVINGEPLENNDEAFGDEAFGDLKTDNLPSFFTTSNHNDDDSLNILDSYAGLKVSEGNFS